MNKFTYQRLVRREMHEYHGRKRTLAHLSKALNCKAIEQKGDEGYTKRERKGDEKGDESYTKSEKERRDT